MRSSISQQGGGGASQEQDRAWPTTSAHQQATPDRERTFSNDSRTSRISRPRGSSPTSSTAGDVGVDESDDDSGAGPSVANMSPSHQNSAQRRARTGYDVRSSRRDFSGSKHSSPYLGEYETHHYSPSSPSSGKQRSQDGGVDEMGNWSKQSSDSIYSDVRKQSKAAGWTRRERLPSAFDAREWEPRSPSEVAEYPYMGAHRTGSNRVRTASASEMSPTSPQRNGMPINGAPSLAERKRRLASASGNVSLIEQPDGHRRQPSSPRRNRTSGQFSPDTIESAVFGSAQRRERRGDAVRKASYTHEHVPTSPSFPIIERSTQENASVDNEATADALASKPTLRERIFGARRPSTAAEPHTPERAPHRTETWDDSLDRSRMRVSRSDPRYLDASAITPSGSDKTMQYRSPRVEDEARFEPRTTPNRRSRLDLAATDLRARMADRATHRHSMLEMASDDQGREHYGTPEVLDRDHYDIEAASRDSVSSLEWQQEGEGRSSDHGAQKWQDSAAEMSTSSSAMDNDRYSVAPSPDDLRARSNSGTGASSLNGMPVPVPRTTSLRHMRHGKRESRVLATAGSAATSSNGMDSPMRSQTAMSSYVESTSSMTGSVSSEVRMATPPQSLHAISEARSSWRDSASSAAGAAGAGALAVIRTTFGESGQMQPITPEQLEALQDQMSGSVAAIRSGSGSSLQQPNYPNGHARSSTASSEATQSKTSTADSWQKIEIGSSSSQLAVAKEPIRPRKSPLRVTTPRNSESSNPRSPGGRQAEFGSQVGATQSTLERHSNIQNLSRLQPPSENEAMLQSRQDRQRLSPLDAAGIAAGKRPSLANAFESSDTIAAIRPATPGDDSQDASGSSDPTGNSSEDAYRYTVDAQHTPKTLARRAMTLRKITPPTLMMPFSRKDKNSASSSPHLEASAEAPEHAGWDESLSSAEKSEKSEPRKSTVGKVFGFKKDREERESGRLGIGMRSKREAHSQVRPSIRRIYGDGAQSEADIDGVSPGARSAIESPMLDSALASPGHGLLSMPNTPNEELPAHVKRLVRRCNAVFELVETEASYASDLNVVRDIYLARIKERLGGSVASLLQASHAGSSTSVISLPQPKVPKAAVSSSASSFVGKSAPRSSQGGTQKDGTLSTSTGVSNRSSIYTTSSQASGSDLSSVWPPTSASLPGTPPVPQGTFPANQKLAAPSRPSSLLRTPSHSRVGSGTKPRISASTSAGSGLSAGTRDVNRDAPLSAADVRIIFAYLEEAAALADTMAQELRSALGSLTTSNVQSAIQKQGQLLASDDTIGQTFRSFIPRLQFVYTAYCSRHEASMQRLQEVIAHSPKGAKFLQDCTPEARKRTTAWDLGSLLIKPVQRVLKYPLLLREIVNATDASHPDYAALVASFEDVQKVADRINQVKRRKDLAGNLIFERTIKEVSGHRTLSGGKAKKKASSKALFSNGSDNMLLMDDPGDEAIEQFAALLQSFNLLQQRTIAFGRRCRSWSIALFNTYQSEISLVSRLQQIYALQSLESAGDGQMEQRIERPPASGEEKVILGYITLLKLIVDKSWRAMDAEIARSILPMTQKIEEMFDAPRLVIAKRAERQPDYNRYRQVMAVEGGHSKMPDRKIIESANGFVALQGQLLDEIPHFMQGVQILLDVGVHAFARLQAAHMDEVRTLILSYWSKEGEHGEEVDLLGAEAPGQSTMGPRLRDVHLIRKFWEGQHGTMEKLQSLSIGHQQYNEMLAEDGEVLHTPLSERSAKLEAAQSSLSPYLGTDESRSSSMTNLMAGRYSHSNASNSSVLPAPGARRPSGVAGLMRSISGSFAKEPSPRAEVAPPLPLQAASNVKKHAGEPPATADSTCDTFTSAVSDVPPSLPSLMFKEEDRGGFFIQNRPISFLDSREQESAKTPLSSPLQEVVFQQMGALANANGVAGGKKPGHTKTRSQVIRDFYVAVAQKDSPQDAGITRQPSPLMSSAQLSQDADLDRRHRSREGESDRTAVLPSRDSLVPPPAEKEMQKHLEWPYVRFVRGDTFKVISSDATSKPGTVLLFGRIDRTGELGWADESNFAVPA